MKTLSLLMSIPVLLISQSSSAAVENNSANAQDSVAICQTSDTTGTCLGVYESTGGYLFSATPSVALLTSLGYEIDNSELNAGKTYATEVTETAGLGPAGGVFATFRQDGYEWNSNGNDANYGANGQYDRYCQMLSELKVGGRSSWYRPTLSTLQYLQTAVGKDDLIDAGWAVSRLYWTSTKVNGGFKTVPLFEVLGSSAAAPTTPTYVSCVANPTL